MPARFIKDGATQITALIAHIINLSLYSGNVSNNMTIGRVVLLYNFFLKPTWKWVTIALFQFFLKNIGMGCLQPTTYMTSQNLFYDLQSGFRSSYSTDTCLTYLTDHIRVHMDKGFYTGMVMID